MNATEWIDSLQLEEADKTALKGIATKKPEAFNGFLAQNEFSRKMNELDTQRKSMQEDFDKKQRDVDSFKGTLIETRGKIDKQYKKAIQERDQALQALNAKDARIKEVADANGLDINDFGNLNLPPANSNGNAGAHANGQSQTQQNDDELNKKFYTRDEAFSDATGQALLTAMFNDLSAEYQELTGKRPTGAVGLMEKAIEALKAGKPQKFDELFDQHYGMADLRTARSKQQQEEHDELIRRETREKVLSESMVNTASGTPGHVTNSPVLRYAEKKAAESNTGATAQQQRSLRVANLLNEEARKAAV